jgi:hypothetical protein
LDFVEVPSPYAGAERWYNPQHFGSVPYYSPPFNKLSRFRDPGRININTIFDQDVWDAVVSQFPGMRNTDGFFAKMAYSRKGSAGVSTSGNWYDVDPSLPTRFANPFRPADSADLMPNIPPGAASATNMRKFNPVEATFLRPDPDTLTGGGATAQPLFQINSTNTQIGNWTAPTGQYHDVTKNPYFTYQPLQKIGNILTTQSNCFAVWITIGYFEVDPVAVDAAHPDGFTLGQEVGADSGEITRHRAFYIIDRSVPVGFIPGSRLNTDDCILLRRLIEGTPILPQ